MDHHTDSSSTGDIARLEENAASNKNNKKKVEDIRQRDAIEGVVYKVHETLLRLLFTYTHSNPVSGF
jgi:hypothetical protein